MERPRPVMTTNDSSRARLLLAALLASALLTSCSLRVTKGDVAQAVSKDLKLGADKEKVIKYLHSLKVNGVGAAVGEYVPNTLRDDVVVAPDGKGLIYDGHVAASFDNGVRGVLLFCEAVFVTCFFDENGRLIMYHVDC